MSRFVHSQSGAWCRSGLCLRGISRITVTVIGSIDLGLANLQGCGAALAPPIPETLIFGLSFSLEVVG
jgi:hypothetical protein